MAPRIARRERALWGVAQRAVGREAEVLVMDVSSLLEISRLGCADVML
jgi:hypothetical protein